MSIFIKSAVRDTIIVTLTSISGSIIWQAIKEIYNFQRYNKLSDSLNESFLKSFKKMIKVNIGMFIGFGLAISYIYTGKPFIYHLLQDNNNPIIIIPGQI